MIRSIRRRLEGKGPLDSGMSMIEVVVALMLVTVVILGMAFSLGTMTKLTDDTQNREVAAGLAAQEIDKTRATSSAFDVHSADTAQVVNGVTYTIHRYANWVSSTGSTKNCGGGGGVLQYKQVNVGVTWPNMLTLTNPIQADTILSPSSRINDPSYGTIIVSVLGANGTGRSGVAVTVSQVSGGDAVGAVDATDTDGCSFALKVSPGTYSVKISKSNYIDYNQVASPSITLTVQAGSASTASFSYDNKATYSVKYASNFGASNFKLPDALTTNYISSKGNYAVTTAASPISLYPLSEGYAAVAGSYTSTASTSSGCLSVDPVTWSAGTVNGVALADGARVPVGVAPGGNGTITVPMGVIAVTWPATATSMRVKPAAAPAGSGDPGCAQGTTYNFTYSSVPSAGSTVYLAVPFGSWQVVGVTASLLELPILTPAAATRGQTTGAIITLDPRNPQ